MGNAATLSSQSEMWRSVIEELEENDAVGEGFPIQCDRHPQEAHLISKPGELPRWAPDGKFLVSQHRMFFYFYQAGVCNLAIFVSLVDICVPSRSVH